MDMPTPDTRLQTVPELPKKARKERPRASSRISSVFVAVVVAAVGGLSIWYLLRPQPLLVQGEADATPLDIAARVDGRAADIPVVRGQNVAAAAAALGVLERRLEKTVLRAPADGVVTEIVAEVGENVHAGQPVLVIAETNKQWLSFNVREDLLHGLAVGATVDVVQPGTRASVPAVVTELAPLGSFATWQAERAIGDHDRNTLRLRLDFRGDPTGFEPGMTVWLQR